MIDVVYKSLKAKWKQQRLSDAAQAAAWNDYVPKHLLPRLHGYKEPMKYWLSTLPEDVPLQRMVLEAKMRWRIERD